LSLHHAAWLVSAMMLNDDRARSFGNLSSYQLTQLTHRRLDLPAVRRNSLQNFMRRARIPVYASAGINRPLAQLGRRMMSQIDLTKANRDCVDAIALTMA